MAWDPYNDGLRMILISFALLLSATSTEDYFLASSFGPPCLPGWKQFLDSCYHIENKTMSLPKAEKSCATKGATLFVANSLEEFNKITRSTPRNLLSWIGLAQFDERTTPIWQTTSGIEPSKLKWVVIPFSSVINGWSTASRCVAYYNSDVETARYTYFYPCESLFSSICENNSTFNTALAHQFDQL